VVKIPFLFLAALLLTAAQAASAQAVIDTTGGRYYRPVFANVTVASGVAYGAAVNSAGINQTLLMDVYQPTSDALARRPVIVLPTGVGSLPAPKPMPTW